MEDLEGRTTAMAWDWDVDDIDADKDDGKQWVPVTPQTMKNVETPRPSRMAAPTQPAMPMPVHQMTMYALHPT